MEGGAGRQEGLVGLTLRAVLGKHKDRPVRTLLDIIRQEEPNSRAYANLIEHHESNKGWKFFMNRLNLNKRRWDGDVRGDGTQGSDVVCPDVVSTSNVMGGDRGCENSPRQALAQLLRARSVRIVESAREDDDDSNEVPWAQPAAQVQLRSLSWSGVVSSRPNEVGDEHVRVSDVSVPNMNNQLQSSLLGQTDEPVRSLRLSEALAAEREHMQMVISSTEAPSAQNEEHVTETNNDDAEQGEIDSGRESANEQQQAQPRRSLMDLLDETDMLVSRASYIGEVNDHNDEENEDGAEVGSNSVEQNCCVCMVRHKGSAFIPCGHTFCRLCSRELWVNRGNCPICNGFILEILDIF